MTAESARPGRLGVGIVGAGRVGAVLGSALRGAGHAMVGASGVSEASRERIDTLLPGVPVLEIPDVIERAELVVLAVPDDALAPLVEGLSAAGVWQPGQIVVHTSGRYGIGVLDPARRSGVIPLAIHPAMTFSGTSLDLARLEGTTFAVTAPSPVLPIGQALVVEIGGEPVVIAEEARGLYHAALAHGANHLVVLVAQAAQALAAAGVEHPGRVLEPLLGAALDGAVRAADTGSTGLVEPFDDREIDPVDDLPAPRESSPGAISALTGPVARGDVGTVVEHLRVLEEMATVQGATDVPSSYRELARAATRRSLATARIDRTQAEGLLDALEDDA